MPGFGILLISRQTAIGRLFLNFLVILILVKLLTDRLLRLAAWRATLPKQGGLLALIHLAELFVTRVLVSEFSVLFVVVQDIVTCVLHFLPGLGHRGHQTLLGNPEQLLVDA